MRITLFAQFFYDLGKNDWAEKFSLQFTSFSVFLINIFRFLSAILNMNMTGKNLVMSKQNLRGCVEENELIFGKNCARKVFFD